MVIILITNKTIDKKSSHNPYTQDYARFFVQFLIGAQYEGPAKLEYMGFGGYALTKEQPADWSTAYASYFVRSDGRFTAVTGDTAPEWAEGKYYSKAADTDKSGV